MPLDSFERTGIKPSENCLDCVGANARGARCGNKIARDTVACSRQQLDRLLEQIPVNSADVQYQLTKYVAPGLLCHLHSSQTSTIASQWTNNILRNKVASPGTTHYQNQDFVIAQQQRQLETLSRVLNNQKQDLLVQSEALRQREVAVRQAEDWNQAESRRLAQRSAFLFEREAQQDEEQEQIHITQARLQREERQQHRERQSLDQSRMIFEQRQRLRDLIDSHLETRRQLGQRQEEERQRQQQQQQQQRRDQLLPSDHNQEAATALVRQAGAPTVTVEADNTLAADTPEPEVTRDQVAATVRAAGEVKSGVNSEDHLASEEPAQPSRLFIRKALDAIERLMINTTDTTNPHTASERSNRSRQIANLAFIITLARSPRLMRAILEREMTRHTQTDHARATTFLERVKQHCSGPCAICHEDMHDPVITVCGHVFDRECLTVWTAGSLANNRRCPTCRAGLGRRPYLTLQGNAFVGNQEGGVVG